MLRVTGRYNEAVCYTDALEETAEELIRTLCDQAFFEGCRIRIMPDVHAGKGCTIGTTMKLNGRVPPAMVGVDIGCGMETIRISDTELDLERLDRVIRERIPSGQCIRGFRHPLAAQAELDSLRCTVNRDRALLSIGTLGGGNHFIEVDRAENGEHYLVIHSGSRHLGTEVANYYCDEAWRALQSLQRASEADRSAVIERLKAEGRQTEIPEALAALARAARLAKLPPKHLAYVEGRLFEDYIHDMRITQHFAALNRQAMAREILDGMGWHEVGRFTTIHNYVDTEHMIVRKGAVSAQAGEKLLIPINMRDGALVCVGKGNEEWNCSAPHGAGRILSRMAAQEKLTVEQFAQEMQGIYTTCVGEATLDESPMAYKSLDEIVRHIGPTVEILERIRPIYNFKAS